VPGSRFRAHVRSARDGGTQDRRKERGVDDRRVALKRRPGGVVRLAALNGFPRRHFVEVYVIRGNTVVATAHHEVNIA
jgi:hypothetical protein